MGIGLVQNLLHNWALTAQLGQGGIGAFNGLKEGYGIFETY
jgi:hypothetical protein